MSGNGEYISREAANEACREAVRRYPNSFYNGIEAARDAILKLPAADVRPIVLCRDCKWYQIDELKKDGTADRRYKPSVCVLAERRRDPNHFCADGKKREES